MRRTLTVLSMALLSTGVFAQADRADRRQERLERREERSERREERQENRREDRAEARNDRRDRPVFRDRDRDRGFVIRFGAPGYFVRTLPPRERWIVFDGRRCRVTITRRLNYRGDIVTTERRRCPGRPEVVIRSR